MVRKVIVQLLVKLHLKLHVKLHVELHVSILPSNTAYEHDVDSHRYL
jgi:hypothetical protein